MGRHGCLQHAKTPYCSQKGAYTQLFAKKVCYYLGSAELTQPPFSEQNSELNSCFNLELTKYSCKIYNYARISGLSSSSSEVSSQITKLLNCPTRQHNKCLL